MVSGWEQANTLEKWLTRRRHACAPLDSLSLSLYPPGIRNAARKVVGTREGGERRRWTERRRKGCTVAPVHAPGAFHNPEYCSRIHIYATSPGDNSAIMRRGRARVQLGSPPRATNPPCDFHSIPLPFLHLSSPPRAWNCSESRTSSWFIQRCNGKNKAADVSGPVQTANRLSRFLSLPTASLLPVILLSPKFLLLSAIRFSRARWNLLTAERRDGNFWSYSKWCRNTLPPTVGSLFTRFQILGKQIYI